MEIRTALICALAGLAIVGFVVPLILRAAGNSKLLRRPVDFHHTHTAPIPRLGGLALVLAFLGVEIVVAILVPQPDWLRDHGLVVLSSLAIFGLGFWDDLKPLGAKWKLAGQVAVGVFVYCCGIGIQGFKIPFFENQIEMRSIGLLLTVIWLVGMTNLINLIDGVDGLAAGISLLLVLLLGFMMQGGGSGYLMWGMAGALVGFLWFNFPPARIYLGDGGAYFLGFLLGLLSLLSYQKSTILAALMAPLLVLALPILDTLITVARRGLRGLPIFRADRLHLHHRLMNDGMSRRQVVLYLYGATLFFLALAFAAFVSRGQLIPLSLGIGSLALILCARKFKFSREWFAVTQMVGNSLAMRGEVQYGLALTRWLALEGARAQSLEDLWQDLVFAGKKLGFTYIKLTLPDAQREWVYESVNRGRAERRKILTAGSCGVLELRVETCDLKIPSTEKSCRRLGACPCPSHERLFLILCDLLVEGWMTAIREYTREQGMELIIRPTTFPAVDKTPA